MSSALELEPLSPPDTRALCARCSCRRRRREQVDERLARAGRGQPTVPAAARRAAARDGIGDVSLPPTIQALLAARLDRLAPAERAAIGAASVVGREFWGDAVGALSPDQEEQGVRELAQRAGRKRLVVPEKSTLESEEGYSFTHVLVRDAAYEALTKQDRAELHERVADWLERRHPERMIELEAIVGHHLEDAYRHHADLGPIGPRGYALAQRAARRAGGGGLTRRASARGHRGGGAAASAPPTLLPANARERVAMLPLIAEALEGNAQHAKAKEMYERAIEAAGAAGTAASEAYSRVRRAGVRFLIDPEVDARSCVAEAEAAIGTLEREDDSAASRRPGG